MTGLTDTAAVALSFSDFPEDVQLCILSFLSPSDISTFASTSKQHLSFCRNDSKVWFSLCHRRWSSKTIIHKWANNQITFKRLYSILHHYENLIGFWRRSGQNNNNNNSSPLILFQWGPSFITASRLSPSKNGTYSVLKEPFLYMSVTTDGHPVNFLDPQARIQVVNNDVANLNSENDLVPVNVSFIGNCHVMIEANVGGRREDEESGSPGSFPDRLMSDIYQYFANRTSPGGDRAFRRQRRRERERQWKKKWEAEHFVKIVNCSPTPSRPFQGLWKGICDDMSLDFYLVEYDDIGGLACRRVDDSSETFSGFSPVFWTPNITFIKSPLSPEEDYIYNCREHMRPHLHCSDNEAVSRILYINSSYDLVIPDTTGTVVIPRRVEGRLWEYKNGTFGFGFLRDNHIVDLKHIAQNGVIIDTVEPSNE